MSAGEWGEVFRAGWDAIPHKGLDAGSAIALALRAMELKCAEIAARELL